MVSVMFPYVNSGEVLKMEIFLVSKKYNWPVIEKCIYLILQSCLKTAHPIFKASPFYSVIFLGFWMHGWDSLSHNQLSIVQLLLS